MARPFSVWATRISSTATPTATSQGVRIYTLFMYLNDVPEGGGTRFTDLPSGPVTFQPQRGKAILWPSVLESDPDKRVAGTPLRPCKKMVVLYHLFFACQMWVWCGRSSCASRR